MTDKKRHRRISRNAGEIFGYLCGFADRKVVVISMRWDGTSPYYIVHWRWSPHSHTTEVNGKELSKRLSPEQLRAVADTIWREAQ